MTTRRTLLGALGATPALTILPAAAQDAAFPNRPIRILLAFAPGGGTDLIARTVASAMQGVLGQPVVVENRPGAGGNIATEAAATSRPDGYTILMGNHGPMSVNVSLFRNMRIDPERALEPIGLVADAPLVVVVGPKSRAQNLRQLLDEVRAANGQATYGSASNGSASHLAAALMLQMAGLRAEHVPFRGAGPALTDVVAGHLDFMITTLPSVVGLIQGGQVRPLAVTGEGRIAVLPEVPPVADTIPGYKATAWYGLLVPRGTPADVQAKLYGALREALANPDVIRRLRDEGAEPSSMDGKAFAELIRWERERWATVIRQANITVD
ncbi:Bug family tripartite tricarboxylate transporter substrate binding protein [Neoroseomonas oryzicola]|uniref:Tripartite tricarboxylate transporter substrate binding protein n=1 Tax=Neoroseomonas oryzicola TaxID=535904 RepID=A0A9X9WE30_9PROT|nr:tripartite tricarboxylate transporter substrate binding protein [Neoroseomonas oryzicola]MBR0658590.1 tripartite tricarboxylate transporter substrate binding protein [Neoroseomonas oryzicola]NKE16621.1 tripartite tricarboxylate transporter substrate binding protein [Neoroseomonas oryzicola]